MAVTVTGESEAPALDARSVRSGYGRVPVLRGVSVRVDPGEIVAVVGPNGAGKTTLLRTLSGELLPTSGSVHRDGVDISRSGVRERLVGGVVHIPEHRHLFASLSVEENLQLGGAATIRRSADSLAERIERVVGLFPILGDRLHHAANTLSGGQQQMLAIGRGLMSEPTVILLDEPSLGLAPAIVDRILDAFVSLAEQGAAVVLVEQFVESALSVASRGYVLRDGEIQLEGPSQNLLTDSDALAEAYFGVGGAPVEGSGGPA
jgi:branched-chain amino acid transport system ATP-binding protein